MTALAEQPPKARVKGAYGVRLTRRAPLRLEPHPKAPTELTWIDWASRQKKPLAVDLFSGAGGLSFGLEEAGYRVALAVDNDPLCVESHRYNFCGLALQRDLADSRQVDDLIAMLRAVPVALLAGGPPCQPFSRAGRSKIRSLVRAGVRPSVDDRRELWRVFLRVALAVRPEAILLENVPDMALGDDLAVVRVISEALEAAGYDVHVRLVDAWRYGVPQHRQRLIMVAVPTGVPFTWPRERPRVNLWDAIGDLPPLGEGTGDRELAYDWRQPLSDFQRRARRQMWEAKDRGLIWDHETRPVREDDRRAFALMTSSTRYSDLPAELRRYRDDSFDDKYKRLGRNELSRSITAHIAKDGYWYIHPTELRTLTVREAGRLQTFPDDFRFAGSRSDAFRQIGNAVPPLLARSMSARVLSACRAGPSPQPSRSSAGVLVEMRRDLADWASRQRQLRPWAYPADKGGADHAWQVLLSTVLLSARADTSALHAVMTVLKSRRACTDKAVLRATAEVSPAVRRAVQRAQHAAESAKAGEEAWWSAARLGPAEQARFALLALGEDRLPISAPALRVAARVTGEPVDRVNRNSAGRVALARLVGAGELAPLRMAAVAEIGASICFEDTPACGACPLLDFCPGTDFHG